MAAKLKMTRQNITTEEGLKKTHFWLLDVAISADGQIIIGINQDAYERPRLSPTARNAIVQAVERTLGDITETVQ